MAGQTVRQRRGKSVLPAKLSAPRLTSIHPRPRLFALLDKASRRPVVWVQGLAGAGKTTLVASYLNERAAGPMVLGRRGDADAATVFHYLAQAHPGGVRGDCERTSPSQFRRGDKGHIGRRLDFLMQELNREANTLGSKAADVRVTNAAVDLKTLIEQMRQQVQNIEQQFFRL